MLPSATARPSPTPPPPTATPTHIPYTTPAWFDGAVVYEIFVRSFADSDGDGIGDLNGIRAHLDYLEALNVDVVWLMPIYPSPSVHGYDVTDFRAVNPDYGTLADLQALVAELHARGMRLILDFVPSHLSSENPLFSDAYGAPSSPHSGWFIWTNEAHTTYATFAGNMGMPRFNHYDPDVVEYLTQSALYWLDLDYDGDFADGVDGFRVDNATFPPHEFFETLRQRVKAANPDALLLGEAWLERPAELGAYYSDQFDALFDFPLYALLEGNPGANQDGLLAGASFPVLLTRLFEEQAGEYPPGALALRFLSNHDTNRIASEVARDPDRERLAAALTAVLPGPVMIYYGEELGMPGQKGGAPYYDNYRREPMDWYASGQGELQTTWFAPEDRWNQPADGVSVEEEQDDPVSLLSLYRRLLALRRQTPVLRSGDFTVLEVQTSGPGPWAIYRGDAGAGVAALFNFATEPREATLAAFPFDAAGLLDPATGMVYPGAQVGEPYTVSLTAGQAVLLVPASSSTPASP